MSVLLSCVTDGSPKYDYQALVWATTSLRLAGRGPDELIVHTTGGKGPLLQRVEELGVEVAPLEPFDPAWPLAHKIGQLTSPALRLRRADHVLLCDCDLAFAGDPVRWIDGSFRAKPVDLTKPSIEVWRQLFRAEGFPEDPEACLPTNAPTPTYARNLNAGLLIVPASMLDGLADAWGRWYERTGRHRELLRSHAKHVVQISLALALRELDVEVDHLPLALNCPTHLGSDYLDALECGPVGLHYHHRIDVSGLLEETGAPRVDTAIQRVNAVLAEEVARLRPRDRSRPVARRRARVRRQLALLLATARPDRQ